MKPQKQLLALLPRLVWLSRIPLLNRRCPRPWLILFLTGRHVSPMPLLLPRGCRAFLLLLLLLGGRHASLPLLLLPKGRHASLLLPGPLHAPPLITPMLPPLLRLKFQELQYMLMPSQCLLQLPRDHFITSHTLLSWRSLPPAPGEANIISSLMEKK
jgi:hypothetical protein